MNDWEIVDSQGFRWLRLGMDRSSALGLLGPYRTFRRTPASKTETDHFIETGFLVTYGPDDRVAYIEVVSPATPRLAGVLLLERGLDAVSHELREAGLAVTRDDLGAKVVGRGVGLYAPSGVVEGVSIGEG
jgi:hypothetical protein